MGVGVMGQSGDKERWGGGWGASENQEQRDAIKFMRDLFEISEKFIPPSLPTYWFYIYIDYQNLRTIQVLDKGLSEIWIWILWLPLVFGVRMKVTTFNILAKSDEFPHLLTKEDV